MLYAYLSRAGDYAGGRGRERSEWPWRLSGPDYGYRMEFASGWARTTETPAWTNHPLRRVGSRHPDDHHQLAQRRRADDEPGETDYIAVLFDPDNLNPDIDADPEGVPYTWTDGLFPLDGVEDLSGSDATRS